MAYPAWAPTSTGLFRAVDGLSGSYYLGDNWEHARVLSRQIRTDKS